MGLPLAVTANQTASAAAGLLLLGPLLPAQIPQTESQPDCDSRISKGDAPTGYSETDRPSGWGPLGPRVRRFGSAPALRS